MPEPADSGPILRRECRRPWWAITPAQGAFLLDLASGMMLVIAAVMLMRACGAGIGVI